MAVPAACPDRWAVPVENYTEEPTGECEKDREGLWAGVTQLLSLAKIRRQMSHSPEEVGNGPDRDPTNTVLGSGTAAEHPGLERVTGTEPPGDADHPGVDAVELPEESAGGGR